MGRKRTVRIEAIEINGHPRYLHEPLELEADGLSPLQVPPLWIPHKLWYYAIRVPWCWVRPKLCW